MQKAFAYLKDAQAGYNFCRDLSNSGLSGEIPKSLANFLAIVNLNLSGNNLTGSIPVFLAKLPQLRTLDLLDNDLNGTVPDDLPRKKKDGSLLLSLMWKTTPVTLLFLAALMSWLDPPGVLLFDWSFRNTMTILISAALGFLLQLSGALAGATSATSHVILGQFKTCVILLGGSVYFHTNPGLVTTRGAATALLAMSVYTSLTLRQAEPETKLPSNAASFPPEPRAKEVTVTSSEDVNATAESV